MRLVDIAACLSSVVLASIGQVMLRAAALSVAESKSSGILVWINGSSLSAVSVYLAAMVVWIWVLGRVPLTQAFSFFGLSFFLVPLLAHVWLGDSIALSTWIGAAVIVAGIIVTTLPH